LKSFIVLPAAILIFLLACKTSGETIKRDLIDMELQRSKAIAAHDTSRLVKMYTDDFRGVTAIGYPVTKEILMEVFKRDNPDVVFTNTDHWVSVLNRKTAILTGKLTGKTKDGKVVHESLYIHVLVKEEGRWQIRAGQGTSVLKQ
jgi:ketosteroid isomerase-like protein